MRHETKPAVLILVLSVIVGAAEFSLSVAGEPPQKSERPKLYDTGADGKEQIAAALKTAKAEDKRMLLKFGADW